MSSGVARISKLGGTPVTWPEGPMRMWVFRGGQRSWPPPQEVLGRAVTTSHEDTFRRLLKTYLFALY